MARDHDLEADYRSAASEYASAASRYEVAVMSGDRAERAAAEEALDAAGERYARAMAATVETSARISLEEALTQSWAQPDPHSIVLASIVAQEAAQQAVANTVVRTVSAGASFVAQPWNSLNSLASRLVGATAATGGTAAGAAPACA